MGDKTKIDALAPTNVTAEYRFGYTHEELERLRYQHYVWAKENQQFISRAGFSKDATLVDLGCGPGYTTLDLAQIVGSGGKVIAVDRDGERSLPLLNAQAEAIGLFNIETKATSKVILLIAYLTISSQSGRHVQKNLTQFSSVRQ